MKKFFALIKKPTDIYEVYSIIKFYKIKDITIYLSSNTWASYPDFKTYCISKIKKKNLKIKIKKINIKKISHISWLKKLEKFQIIALPLNWHKFFYLNIEHLRSNGKKIILISDGIIDALDLSKYVLIKITSIFSIYRLLSYFKLKNNISDECFFTNYPLKTPHAKKTFPVSKTFLPDHKLIKLLKKNNINNLILGTREKVDPINLNKFITKYKIKNYCYYERGKKKIIINNKIIKLKNILVAEEIINTNLIKFIHGTLSTTIFYAKVRKIKINLLLNKFRPFFLYYFLKKKFYQTDY